MSFGTFLLGLGGIERQLSRIADVLERVYPPPAEPLDASEPSISYFDEHARWELEQRQEAFYRRTGRRLSEGEEPPKHFFEVNGG